MTIREIAAKTNMSTDTLRYYERIGLLPPVPRNAAGIRNYDEYFVNFINFIKNITFQKKPRSFSVLHSLQVYIGITIRYHIWGVNFLTTT